jgi:hypothetical protein
MKLTFKQTLLNEIKKQPRGYMDIIAKEIGYSSGSALGKILSEEDKEFKKFNSLVKLVGIFWGIESIKYMIEYSEEIDPNNMTLTSRNLLEFLASTRQFEALNNLLDKMDKCDNKESREWAKVYRMELKYQIIDGIDSVNELIQEISNIHVTKPELEAYKKIYIHYCCYLKKDYETMEFLLKQIQKEVKLIKNEYIKERYLIKVNEIAAYTNLYAYNNKEVAREYADWILESSATPSYKAYANFIKGVSYTFTSYNEAIKYLNESIKIYETIGRWDDIKEIEQEIEFINIYWDKNCNCDSVKNELFMKVKNGEQISIEELNGVNLDQEFKLFIDGYGNKDNKKLLLSLIKFIKNDNLFLANLPKIELIKNGYDQDIISAMISINVA